MGKRVTHYAFSMKSMRFGMNKELLRIACDDGSTYVFVRQQSSPRFRLLRRIDHDGSFHAEPSRLPSCIEACMDGITRSGPYGDNSSDYWV